MLDATERKAANHAIKRTLTAWKEQPTEFNRVMVRTLANQLHICGYHWLSKSLIKEVQR